MSSVVSSVGGGLARIGNAHPVERDAEGEFVWAREVFVLPDVGAAHMLLRACYLGGDGELTVTRPDGRTRTLGLHRGWHSYLLPRGDVAGPLRCRVDPVVPCPGDPRTLGLCIRSVEAVDDLVPVRRRLDREANARHNQAEYEAGVTVLRSIPPQLRTSLSTRCNVVPRCSYCHWDYAKDLERRLDFELGGLDTLRQLGELTRLASEVHDCSWGEVFVHDTFPAAAAFLFESGLACTFTSNGMLMTEDKVAPLLGQDAMLYVSLDASNAERFRRYRNELFDDVVRNVRRLCEVKRAHGGKPEVHVLCIAMASNLDDVPAVLELAADLGVDGFFLQALHDQNMSRHEPVVRAGHAFDYAAECVDLATLAELSERLRPRAEALGLKYRADTTDYGHDAQVDERLPLCSEPWKTVYPVSRGVTPCCFGREPIAYWDDRGDQSVEAFIREAINNPAMQELRRRLAARELPDYCRRCTSCPITKRYVARESQTAPLQAVSSAKE